MMAQWVDEGMSSTPMGALIYGSMLRRIWHFPNYRFQPTEVTQDGHGSFDVVTIAQFNHPVAFKLFDEGLREGNWIKAFLSMHIVEDTAGHSGFTAEAGHAWAGHWPDRTWVYPGKYKAMTGLIFKMLLALRKIAPDEALVDWAQAKRREPVQPTEFKELEEEHWADVGRLISRDYFRDPRYTPAVVSYILRMAQAKGYIKKSLNIEATLPKPEDYIYSPEEQERRLKNLDQWQAADEWTRTQKCPRGLARVGEGPPRGGHCARRFARGQCFQFVDIGPNGNARSARGI